MTPSPQQTVQVQTPRPPQVLQQRAERGSTSVLINPPPPHIGQPIFLRPLHRGHSTIPPCINPHLLQPPPIHGRPTFYHLQEESARKKCAGQRFRLPPLLISQSTKGVRPLQRQGCLGVKTLNDDPPGRVFQALLERAMKLRGGQVEDDGG